jgi:hypothetical protein
VYKANDSRSGNTTHLLQEIAHFPQVAEVGFLFALDVPNMPAPHRISVGPVFQPDPCHERILGSLFDHLARTDLIAAEIITRVL